LREILGWDVDFWGKNGGGGVKRGSLDKIGKAETFENCIETFENYIEIFENCIELFENCIETYKN
jgi:hypothetical protein